MSLEGKTVVVTGAARGLGRDISEAFHALGANVAMIGRNLESTQETATAVGERAKAYQADIGDWADVERVFGEIGADFPSINVLVNNAAQTNPATVEDCSVEYIDSMVRTNLLGTIYCCRAALPLLRAGESDMQGGDIINMSSQSVTSPVPTLATYMGSKAGVEAFSRGLRMEVRPENIRVGTLRVGTMTWKPEEAMAKMGNQTEDGGSQAFMEMTQREGNMTLLNPGMAQASAAKMVVDMVSLPRDAVIDIVELLPTARS